MEVVIGVVVIVAAVANAVFLGVVAARNMARWREDEHVSFVDLKAVGESNQRR